MKKKSLVFLILVAFVVGTMFSTSAAVASTSVTSLQKQIKTLKTTVSKQKTQIAKKDKEISGYKKTVSSKDKEIKKYKSYAVNPLKTKIAYQGNVISGNYQIGNTSVPAIFDYKGIKYAPVNMIGDLLRTKASYNKSSDTVLFGSTLNGSYMSDILKPYSSSNDVSVNKNMIMGGINYNKGYSMQFWSENYYSINLEGKYSNITGVIGIDDNSDTNGNAQILIYGDNEDLVLGTYNIEQGGLPLNVDIDVSGIKKLKVYQYDGQQRMTLDFANVVIK